MKRRKSSNSNAGNIGKEKIMFESKSGSFEVGHEDMAHWLAASCVCRTEISPEAIAKITRGIHPTFRIDPASLSRNIMDVHRVSKEVIQEYLKGFDGQVSLSVDVLKKPDEFLTYLHNKREESDCFLGYMCIRLHLIDEHWKPRNLVLEFCRSDAEFYVEIISKCLKDFNVMNKIATVMVLGDFDSENICGAIKSKIQGNQMTPHMFQVKCCASLLLGMVEDAFEAIEVNKFLELDGCKRLVPMWSIILGQLTQTLELEATGFFDDDQIRRYHDIPSAEEWNRLRDVCKLVTLVNEAAEVLYKTENVTAAVYLYNLQKLRAALIRESVSSDQFLSKMSLSMLQKLYEYWKDTFMVLAFATILDPRCKMKFIEFVSLKYEGDAGNSQIGLVLEAFHNIYNEYETQPPAVGPSSSISEQIGQDLKNENESSENHMSKSYYFNVYAQFIGTHLKPAKSGLKPHSEESISPLMQNAACMCLLEAGLLGSSSESDSDSESGSSNTVREHMKEEIKRLANPRLAFDSLDEYNHFTQSNWKQHKAELDLYLEEPVFPWSRDLNILDWWKAANTKYPTLSRMARDLLAIPLSLSTHDDAYYTDLRTIDSDLVHLKKDMRNALICSRTWLDLCKTHGKKYLMDSPRPVSGTSNSEAALPK